MESLDTLLDATDLMHGLPRRHLQAIAACGSEVRLEPGEYLARWGDVADSFWLVLEGRLALELSPPGRTELTVAVAAPGEIVGFSWLTPPHLMQFDVRALTIVRAARFDGRAVRERCGAEHWLGFELTRRFAGLAAERIEAMSMQLMDVYGDHPVEQG